MRNFDKNAEILWGESSALGKIKEVMDKKQLRKLKVLGDVKSIRGRNSQVSGHQTVHRRYHGRGMSKGKDICG